MNRIGMPASGGTPTGISPGTVLQPHQYVTIHTAQAVPAAGSVALFAEVRYQTPAPGQYADTVGIWTQANAADFNVPCTPAIPPLGLGVLAAGLAYFGIRRVRRNSKAAA
jgi:hypothetical protein